MFYISLVELFSHGGTDITILTSDFRSSPWTSKAVDNHLTDQAIIGTRVLVNNYSQVPKSLGWFRTRRKLLVHRIPGRNYTYA